MKIISLHAENIKRLKAVDITPTDKITTIGGKNRAGKSSVLDSIAYLLGGQKLIPEEPIRRGESEALVTIDLGDYVATRQFYRDTIIVPGGPSQFGETKSTLTIKNKDGASYPSPQAMLDKVLGDLTFDPRAFALSPAKSQQTILRKITNLDTSIIDEARRNAVARRTGLKKQVETSRVKLDGLPKLVPDVPTELISVDEVNAEIARIDGLRTVHSQCVSRILHEQDKQALIQNRLTGQNALIERLQNELADALKKSAAIQIELADQMKIVETVSAEVEKALASIPNSNDVQKKLTELQSTNEKIRHNALRLDAERAHLALEALVTAETTTIKNLDTDRDGLIARCQFPIPGLGFSEDGVTLNGLPFEQASTSEQLSVSVAIGLALNPKLRVLLVRNGESLDSESMALLGQLAEQNDAQLWVERMTESADGVSIMIEDGEVK